ncbi:ROK family protein [Oceanobacillus manasiensis]|uniref:ROK family protein n=1 Tax=Oceanobacillus manasiensis TaxID=586413 RepID=UPI000A02B78B|nr:ROK family protein [Oceanobacillus manasiensis]
MRKFLAFDIGGSLIKYGVVTEKGTFHEKNEVNTEAHLGGPEVLNKVKKIGEELILTYDISGICISTAGQVDSKKGEILYASPIIPNYTGTNVKKELENHFNLPVEVENDVNCVGLAESWIGKGKDAKSMFCLTIGTGIGGSYIIDNKLHTGHSYSGGEIGYIPIEGSQFQELASTKTLIQNVAKQKEMPEKTLDGKKIFKLAMEGDEICKNEIERLVYYLSKGIATITYMMNPEVIVIGGGITNQMDYLYPRIMKQLEIDIMPSILNQTKIEIAGNLNDAGVIGALRYFLLQESLQPFNKITTMIESNKHRLTKGESMIANYITMNLSDVPNHTISEMAEKINVSESMITRFCKKLDIGSYSRLRLMSKEAIVGTRIHDKEDSGSLIEVKNDYINILSKLETLNHTNDLSLFKKKLVLTDRIFLYSSGEMSFLINQFKYKLMKFGIPVDAFSNAYQMEMSQHLLKPESLVIGISATGYNAEIIDMLKEAKKKGATTIAITSQNDSPISLQSDIVLLNSTEEFENENSSIDEISTLYLLEVFFKELQVAMKEYSNEFAIK